MTFLDKWQPQLLSVFRFVTAIVFMQHGTQKLFHFPLAPGAAGEAAPFLSLVWIAGFIEVAGGALLAVGFGTRLLAFLASGEMAIAYFMAHQPSNLYPILNHGDEAILFCFNFLLLAAAGGGAWSVDAALSGTPKMTPAHA